mmetsp:Transcript_21943/g.52443  ORF Transcript_21943/g.52443 Transcript_21943/m.52443 type:complete len:290 (+) Transcript_21943:649-1518(+)
MVACGQFSATSCRDCSFGLYCASPPSIESCSDVRFACWNAAYPGLSGHFQALGLPLESNLWNQVSDNSEGEGLQSYQVDEFAPAEYWEVPLEGMGPVENPVPAMQPATFGGDDFFGGGAVAEQAPGGGDFFSGAQAFGDDPFAAPEHGSGGLELPAEELAEQDPPESFAMPAEMEGENPRVTEMREAMRIRLREVDEREAKVKADASAQAKSYLDSFYKNRTDSTERRMKNNREAEALTGSQEPKGNTYWERIVEYIDFSNAAKSGVDMTRYKNVLFTAKNRNVPVNVN